MKGFIKHSLIILFIIIIISSFASSAKASTNMSSSMSNAMSELESNISNGLIVSDGVIEETVTPPIDGNFFSDFGHSLGNFVISIISKTMEFLSALLSNFMN